MLSAVGTSFPVIHLSKLKSLNNLFPCCTSLRLLQQLHSHITPNGFHLSIFLGSKLANSYFQYGYPQYARQAFDQLPSRNAKSWNTMLSGYFNTRNFSEVLHLYRLYRSNRPCLDSFSLVFAIRACTHLFLKEGRSVHSEAIKFGLERGTYASPSLINMYHELGLLEEAEKVFKEAPIMVPTIWGLMMKGYSKASMDHEVLKSFGRMRDLGIALNPCSAVCVVRAYGNLASAKHGLAIHGLCIKNAVMGSNLYLQTSLLDMYLKSGLLGCGFKLFGEMLLKDVVSWSTMVARLAQCGRACESLQTFRDMLAEPILPNTVTLASVLLACSHVGCVQQGRSTHGYILRNEFELDVVAYTALLDMYAKCGSIKMAYMIFLRMPERNIFSWSAMIGGFGMHGMGSRALNLFDQMISTNVMPNSVTFVSLLSACSHSGRVQEGREYFKSMSRDYGIIATNEHYSCMVDLLGRAGLIEEAETLIKQIPIEPSASVWGALLGACRIHKHEELAEMVANKLFVLEHDLPGTYVLLSNIYGGSEMWEMVKKTREEMNASGLQKTLGFSSIEINEKAYIFGPCDFSHFSDSKISGLWRVLIIHMKELGCLQASRWHNMDELTEFMFNDGTQKFATCF